jgi:hypothetical protein
MDDMNALISTMRQDWDDISRSPLLHKMVMPQLARNLISKEASQFVDLVIWHGNQLDRNVLTGRLQHVQRQMDDANYHSLCKVAIEDVRNRNDSPFLQWINEWYRQRGLPRRLRRGGANRATCVVIECFVDIHFSDPSFTSPRGRVKMKHKIENWRKRGETWYEIIK